ncbi:MAG TPA: hypothetical protein VHA79_06425 [Mycobacteriales bacterium]|nr:hypothetical protein [Mycobacteriales bacterium]
MRTAWDRHQERQAHFLPVARRVTELEELPPGPALITGLRELRATPMTEELALRCVVQWERCESWLAAQKMVMLGEADRVGAERPLLAQELAALTNTAFSAAMGQLGLTDQVARALGSAWSALERGELTLSHVKALGRAVERFPVSVAQRVDEALVPLAIERRWTPAELRRAARRAAIDADPDGAADRAERAKAESDVLLYPRDDDMAGLDAHGDAATMQRVMDVINRDAEQLRRDGDRRPIGVRRITALANAVLGKAAADRPTVQTMVTVDLSTYLGLTNRPGELSGYGPITAELARQLSQDAELVRLITDPIEGTVVDVGRRSYRPTRLVRRIVEALHPVCAFAGCNRRAVSCDKDHRQDWREGGHTSTCNLQPLCRRHHNLKTQRLWSVDIDPDGSEVWTSRLGFKFVQRAPTYPIDLFEPPPDDVPTDVADRIPEHDPDPPLDEIPWPDVPPLSDEEFEAFTRAVDDLELHAWQAAERGYDTFRDLGLIG